jgi:hypothetical protein
LALLGEQSKVEEERDRRREDPAREREKVEKLQTELDAERSKELWQRLFGG